MSNAENPTAPTATRVNGHEHIEQMPPVPPHTGKVAYRCTICDTWHGADWYSALHCHPGRGQTETADCLGCGAAVPETSDISHSGEEPYCTDCIAVLSSEGFKRATHGPKAGGRWGR